MVVQHNLTAMNSNRMLGITTSAQAKSTEKLSSGYKINRAADDAAGLAISEKMRRQIKGLTQASANAQDGISCVQTAEGALAEVHDMLQRMNELAVKSANGTVTDDDRKVIQDEITQLKDEIARIGETTEYNGQKLFDGTFDLKGYTDNKDIKVNYYSDDVNIGVYSLTVSGVAFDELGNVDMSQNPQASIVKTDIVPQQTIPVKVSGTDEQLIISGEDGFEIRIDVSAYAGTEPNSAMDEISNLELDLTGIGGMTLQIGANEGQTIDLRIPELSLLNIGTKRTDVSTIDGANRAIDEIYSAINYVSQMRSRLGAYQNRLVHTENNLATSQENVTAAYSRIMDTDMAEEMTEYTTLQVLSQASTSMLAQANERPSQVLQLLQ